MPVRKAVYFFLCSILLLVLLLLGESYLGPFIQFGFVLLIAAFWKEHDFYLDKKLKGIILIWISFLLSLICSMVFSHSIPLSLTNILNYVFSFIVFVHVLTIKKDFFSKYDLVKLCTLVVFILLIMSTVLLVNKNWAVSLPGMNLLYATYGHNHLASLLVILLPFTWYFSFRHSFTNQSGKARNFFQKISSNYLFVLPTFFVFGILASFGRVAIFIALIQTVILHIYIYRKTRLKKFLCASILITTSILLVLGIKGFFSISNNSVNNCPLPELANKLCKPIVFEGRTQYWSQAFHAIKDFPILGYGPGTFSLISHKYKLAPYLFSSYAHNAFLQQFAESGIFSGAIFCLLMFSLLTIAIKTKRNPDESFLYICISLACISAYSIALFDFDWTFQGIFIIMLSLLALGVSGSFSVKNIEAQNVAFIFFYKGLLIIFFGILSIYILNEVIIQIGQEKLAFRIFPFFSQQQRVFQKTQAIDSEQKLLFKKIYYYHPEMYDTTTSTNDFDLLVHIDPWKSFSQVNGSLTESQLQVLLLLRKQAKTKINYSISTDADTKLSFASYSLAKSYFEQGNIELSAKYLTEAYQVRFWILENEKPFFLEREISDEQLRVFLKGIFEIEGLRFGEFRDQYADAYIKVFLPIFFELSSVEQNEIVKKVINIAFWKEGELTEQLNILFSLEANKFRLSGRENEVPTLLKRQLEIQELIKKTVDTEIPKNKALEKTL